MAGEPENQRIGRLTPLADVLARIETLVTPVAPREIDLASALSRVLAEDVSASQSLPPHAMVLLDGYAVRAEEIADGGPYAPMPLAAPPVRVDVGDTMPPGTDAVVPFDAITERSGRYQAVASTTAGEGVLPAGADLHAGDFIARSGWRLNDFNLAMLAMAGRKRVRVREPRIGLLTNPAGSDPVLDAVTELIARALAARGCLVERCSDLAAVSPSVNAIVGIGGTGSGRNDTRVLALARHGKVEAHGIAIAPGETVAFGMMGSRPVLLLPGRVDAAVAAWLTIGLPLVARLCGSGEADPFVTAPLARKVSSPLGLVEVVPVRLKAGKAEPIASGYWPLASLADTDGWISVPAGSEGFPAGTEVMIRPWP